MSLNILLYEELPNKPLYEQKVDGGEKHEVRGIEKK